MNNTNNSTSLFAGLFKFINEVCSALFVSNDKKEFRRWKDFIAS